MTLLVMLFRKVVGDVADIAGVTPLHGLMSLTRASDASITPAPMELIHMLSPPNETKDVHKKE